VHAAPRTALAVHAAPRTALAVHADWSIDPAKRWMCVATPHERSWLVGAPEPVGDCAVLFDRLRARALGAPVAFGIDCPLGLPRAYAARRAEANFPAFLHGLAHYETMNGQPYNLGLSTANLSKLQLCAKIKQHLPGFVYLEAPIGEDPDKRDYIVSNAKIEATGWRALWSLDDGIKELIKGYVMLRNAMYANV